MVLTKKILTRNPFQILSLPFLARLYRFASNLHNIEVSIRFFSYDGRPIFTCHQSDVHLEILLQRVSDNYSASLTVPGNLLVPGEYYVSIKAHEPLNRILEKHEHILKFRVNETGSKLSRYQPHQYMQGIVIAEFPWKITQKQ